MSFSPAHATAWAAGAAMFNAVTATPAVKTKAATNINAVFCSNALSIHTVGIKHHIRRKYTAFLLTSIRRQGDRTFEHKS